MATTDIKPKRLFLNGRESALEPTGNLTRDLTEARKFLAQKGIDKPQERLTRRAKPAPSWRRRFF